MNEIEITVQGLPESTNSLYTRSGNKILCLSKKAKDFEEVVRWSLCSHLSKQKIKPILNKSDKIFFEIDLFSPKFFNKDGSIKRIDLDNFAKNATDAFFKAINIDDKYVTCLKMSKNVSSRDKTTMRAHIMRAKEKE